jgi:glycosyltransferase involved in cell wall biosynthesis
LRVNSLSTATRDGTLDDVSPEHSGVPEEVVLKRLRVALVTDALYPWHKGGKEIRYLRLLDRLPEHDMDVVVYSMKWWDETPKVVEGDRGSLTYRAICPRLNMYKDTKRSFSQAILFAASTFRLLMRKFDVIEADHMPYLLILPLRLVAWIRRVPLVITWNEVWDREGWRTYLGRAGSLAALLERFCVHLPDAIVAISAGTAEKLAAMGARADRLFVVPITLDFDELIRVEPLSFAPELLFIGRLIEHKNANLAIEATSILVARGLDVRLGIVGVGPEEARLHAQVRELGLDNRVTFYAALESHQDLWALLRGSHVLLAPSVREGFGLVVAESLALGTPVVCALHPENESSKLVGARTGSVVPAFDAQAVADAAEIWLKDESSRPERMAAFQREHDELTLDAMARSYADIFRHVTGTSGPAS